MARRAITMAAVNSIEEPAMGRLRSNTTLHRTARWNPCPQPANAVARQAASPFLTEPQIKKALQRCCSAF